MVGKYYGAIGYVFTDKTVPGVWEEVADERNYYGDFVKVTSKTRDGENLNPNLIFENRLSIVADPFAYENFYAIRYFNWMGVNWQVTTVDVQYPRLLLSIGGRYNG